MKPKIRQFIPLIAFFLLCACCAPAGSQEQDIHDRMMHSRAVDAVVSAMPPLNFREFRDGHAAAGVGPNDMAYYSQIQNWKFQTATPNNTTPYVNFYWNIADGPVVIEIPPSADGVGIFGTIMDSWQRHRVLVNVSQILKRTFLRTISFYILAQEADSLLQPEIMAV